MQASRQVNYFRIGSFVITGIILIVLAIIVFGSGMFFKKVVYVETYFSESVQGLSVGSPVKYLGMEIGSVKEIAAVDSVYKIDRKVEDRKNNRYIYVKMAISPKFFLGKNDKAIKDELARDVASGLRIKLALQGLTGNAYLELDFMNPKDHPMLPINWDPKSFYIPSTVSTLAYFSDNVQHLLKKFNRLKLEQLVKKARDFFASAENATHKVSSVVDHSNRQMIDVISNVQGTAENLNSLTERARGFSSSIIFGKAPPKLDPSKL